MLRLARLGAAALLVLGAHGPSAAEEGPLTPEERYLERMLAIEDRIAEEVDRLPRGWVALQSKHFVCLSQIDRPHTRYVLNFAEEIRDYLDEHFGELGEDKVPRGLIRVFATGTDESAYLQGTRDWWTDEMGEVTLTFGRGVSILAEFSGLARRFTDQYFHIKGKDLKQRMPAWLRQGIWGHIAWGRPSKRKGLVLAPTPATVRALDGLFAQGSALPLQALMTTSTSDLGAGHRAQAESVVHWLLNRGNRLKAKGVITKYLLALEAEETRARAIQTAFGHLEEKDWDRLDQSWKRFARP